VPVLLVATVLLVAGTSDPAQLRHVLPELATWKLALLGYLAFSCGQAGFRPPAITSACSVLSH